jgi:hypothetical protein
MNDPDCKYHYDENSLALICDILASNSDVLSRSRRGVSDTSSSSSKRPLRLTGRDLRERVTENELVAQRFIWQSRNEAFPITGAGVNSLLLHIAGLVNKDLLPEGVYRTWDFETSPHHYGSRVAAQSLESALESYCERLATQASDTSIDPIALAADAEWELNGGSLHPFYDGCGRISRLFSACMLVRSDYLLPLYTGAVEYFGAGNSSRPAFSAYFRHCIGLCRKHFRL